jgi:hypothetical protein
MKNLGSKLRFFFLFILLPSSFSLALPGCTWVHGLTSKVLGPEPIEAQYVPAPEPMLVLVENFRSGSTAELDAAVDQLQIVDLSQPAKRGVQPVAWQERRLTLAARGDYGHTSEQLKLEKLQVASDALRCDAAGTNSALRPAHGEKHR